MAQFQAPLFLLKPLAAAIALAGSPLALASECDEWLVNATADTNTEQTITFDEAVAGVMAGSAACTSIRIDDELAGQTLSWTNGNLELTSESLNITGTESGDVTVSVDLTVGVDLINSALSIANLRFESVSSDQRATSLMYLDADSELSLENTVVRGFSANDVGAVITAYGATLTIRNSVIEDNLGRSNGGAIYNYNRSAALPQATITNSVFRSNGRFTGGFTIGGAITQSNVITTIQDSLFENNGALIGGALEFGGDSRVVVERSTFRGNNAGASGALHFGGQSLTVVDSVFEGNTAEDSGGAISFWQDNLIGPVRLSGVTVVNNRSDSAAGGLYLSMNGQELIIENSTIHGNTGSKAGAIHVREAGELIIENSTIHGNTGSTAGAIHVLESGAVTMHHSTITDNQATGTDPTHAAVLRGENVAGVIITHTVMAGNTQGDAAANNICVDGSASVHWSFLDEADFSTNSLCPIEPMVAQSVVQSGGDPKLGDLADNGGLTLTRMPAANSPLRDAGNPNPSSLPATDQRGSARLLNGVVDIGAVESGNEFPVVSPMAPVEVTFGQPAAIDAGAAFVDPDANTLTYTMTGAPLGLVIDPTTGVISGEPLEAGEFHIVVTATDEHQASATTTFTVNVEPAGNGINGINGGGGSFGFILGLLAPLVAIRKLRRAY